MSERRSLEVLVLKNETASLGDVYLEGSIKQLKNLLKNYLIVKPSCLFDSTIKIDIKVMFAKNGQYSESYSRTVQSEMAHIQKASIRSEFDH